MIIVGIGHLYDIEEVIQECRRIVVGVPQCCCDCGEPPERHVLIEVEGCILVDRNWFQ